MKMESVMTLAPQKRHRERRDPHVGQKLHAEVDSRG
jgi:hypothetical protein